MFANDSEKIEGYAVFAILVFSFFYVLTGDFKIAIALTIPGLSFIVAFYFLLFDEDKYSRFLFAIKRFLKRFENEPEEGKDIPKWSFFLGSDLKGRGYFVNSQRHIGIYGMTRFGKSTMIMNMIHWLITNYSPDEAKICVVDPKNIDYTIFDYAPHMALPRATTNEEAKKIVAWAFELMKSREEDFKVFSEKISKSDKAYLCNNVDRYEQLTEEIYGIKETMPRIFIFVDEIAFILQDKESKSMILDLARLSAAFGIYLVLATQQSRAKTLSGELQNNLELRMVTWMPNAIDYRVAEMPKEIYEEMVKRKGFFAVFNSGWDFVNGNYIDDRTLEETVNNISVDALNWNDFEIDYENAGKSQITGLGLTPTEKMSRISTWAKSQKDFPTISEIMKKFGISKPTAIKYRNKILGR